MKASVWQQRGLTFGNFLLWAILLVIVAVGGMKVIPAYIQDREIRSTLYTIAHDPDLQNASANDIRQAFWKRATTMNNITVVSPDDINIQKGPGGLVLSVSYQVKIPLIGNASLVLEFDTNSTK